MFRDIFNTLFGDVTLTVNEKGKRVQVWMKVIMWSSIVTAVASVIGLFRK